MMRRFLAPIPVGRAREHDRVPLSVHRRPMRSRCPLPFAPFLLLLAAAACGGGAPAEPPLATPSLTLARSRVALGSPLELTYRFEVQPDARFDQDYRVFVHFLDGAGELMWTDDHDPPTPTTQWTPGGTVEYRRTIFLPIYSYVGEATVHLGLYSPRDGRRVPLAGTDAGLREYRVAALQLLPHTENVFVLRKDGWHGEEAAPENPGVVWHWTKKEATLAFRNPRRESVLYLHGDNPGTYAEPQTLTLTVNGAPVDTVAITPRQEFIHRTTLTPEQMGDADMVEVARTLDRSWVPALVASASSRDPRELGIRVFHVFVEPQS